MADYNSSRRLQNLVGRRFGRWLVIARAANRKFSAGNWATYWTCRCDCGTTKEIHGGSLRAGKSRGCYCVHVGAKLTHGCSNGVRLEYWAWQNMLQRCRNPRDAGYKNYGDRGIKVCERWKRFENFFADMGPRPLGRSLDRINNDGNYEPGNCRWATKTEQYYNRRKIGMIDQFSTDELLSELRSRGLEASTQDRRASR
jgi:hypothetical protein